MFAYCNNNPTNATDNTGEIPVHVLVAGAIGALVSAISTLIDGGSGTDVFWSAVQGGVSGAIIAMCPSLAGVFISYEMIDLIFNCLYEGLSAEETILVMGFQLIGEAALPTTNDAIGDLCLDATVGVAKGISASAAITGVKRKNNNSVNAKTVAHTIVSMIGIGGVLGGGCGAESAYFSAEGRLLLCVRIQ